MKSNYIDGLEIFFLRKKEEGYVSSFLLFVGKLKAEGKPSHNWAKAQPLIL